MSDSELVDRIEVRLFVYLRDVGEKRDSGRKLNWKERELRHGSSGAETPSAAEKKTFRQDSGNERKSQPR
jgi:hypothetical protein